MTYALKTSLYFILGILGLGTAIIIGASALTFPFTSSLFLLGLLLVVTGWYRVFHIHPPHKRLGLILGLATLAAVFIIPFSAILFGLPPVLGYATILLGLLTIPPFIAIGLRGDVIRFNEARKREEIEEDVILNTPLTYNVTPKNLEDYAKFSATEVSRDGDTITYRVDDPEFNKIIKDHTLPGMSVDFDKLTPKYEGNVFTPQEKHLQMYFVPKNLKATELEVGQHISFIHNEDDGNQSHIKGTVTDIARADDHTTEDFPEGPIVFRLDIQTQEELDADVWFRTDSDNEAFRLMGFLVDGPEPVVEPLPEKEPIEKMLADTASEPRTWETNDETSAESYLPLKPRTTLPADPFTEVLEEALTGPMPEAVLDSDLYGYKVSAIHIDPTDPKWKGTLTHTVESPETFIKFRKAQPGQTIRFREEDKHYLADAKEVTGTVTHAKIIEDTDGILMDITIDGPDAGTYPVISDHNAVLLDAIGKERINV